MRIVQTFWTAGRDPLKYSFGWSHPEYNLMSWALSCLSLREHYDEVALYTDQEGYDVLISKLHLPYTEVNVVYDKNLCLPQHWAYAKIKTYSLQTKSFLHVDGDVYLPQPIPEDIANAPLIAQNKEIGTDYYRDMMHSVLHNPEMILPKCIEKGLQEDSIASYNMGVFGGNDLRFIMQYCNEVQKFFDTNGMNNTESVNSRIECNVFFEQIILAAYAEEKQEDVGCIISHNMYDQCYTISEFCNLYNFYKFPLHHLLGGHKRNPFVQRMLRHQFANMYPKQFNLIRELTKMRLPFRVQITMSMKRSLHELLIQFYMFVEQQVQNWCVIDANSYVEYEASFVNDYSLAFDAEKQDELSVSCNPHLCTYTFQGLDEDDIMQLRRWFHCEDNFPLRTIAVIPELIGDGFELLHLLPIDEIIIKVIQQGASSIRDAINRILISYNTDEVKSMYLIHYIKEEINHLVKSDIIIINNN
jgi:hypothetical protein